MEVKSMITPQKLEAYRSTAYAVDDSPAGPFAIRIGTNSTEADEACRDLSAESWAYVTAWNPRSERLPAAENIELFKRLVSNLDGRSLKWFPGRGVSADDRWAEESVFVPGLSRAEAVRLGQQFEQYAVVYGALGQPAELVEVPLDDTSDN